MKTTSVGNNDYEDNNDDNDDGDNYKENNHTLEMHSYITRQVYKREHYLSHWETSLEPG